MNFLPKTYFGKVSAGLFVTFVLLFVVFQLLVASGQRGGDTFFDNLALTIPIFLAGFCAVAAFGTGVLSIIREKERSILVFIAAIIGFFVLFFIIGEILVPH